MRDIVSIHGTMYTGLGLPAHTASVNGPAVALTGYNGALVYILAGTWTDGNHAFSIQVTNDNGSGAPNAGGWAAAPVIDLITWTATSPTNFTPVKALDSNGLPTGNVQPASITSAATAINQRIGYIGGVQGVSDWMRVVTTVSGATTGAQYDVVIELGLPRVQPSAV